MAKKTGGKAYDDMTLDELDEFEDEEDDRVMQQYRYSFPYRVSRYPYPIPCLLAHMYIIVQQLSNIQCTALTISPNRMNTFTEILFYHA